MGTHAWNVNVVAKRIPTAHYGRILCPGGRRVFGKYFLCHTVMATQKNETPNSTDASMVLSDDFGIPLLLPILGGVASGAAGAGVKMAFGNSGALWSKGPRPKGVVSFYKDTNFNGPRRDFPIRPHVQNSLSKGHLGLGMNKENDTYSSAIIPEGVIVLAYEHNDRKGRRLFFSPGRWKNFGKWNDKISSFEIIPENPGCTVNRFDEPYTYTRRQLKNGKWVCPSGWTDTGCTWGHTLRETLQCKKRK